MSDLMSSTNMPQRKADDAIISIKIQDDIQTVDARELHAFLNVGRDYTTWVKNRIDEYGFVESQDFEVFTKTGENLKGGRPSKEYMLSLDMAKELALVENSERGRLVRHYFIECEKKLRRTNWYGIPTIVYNSRLVVKFIKVLRCLGKATSGRRYQKIKQCNEAEFEKFDNCNYISVDFADRLKSNMENNQLELDFGQIEMPEGVPLS